jgi:hypothetical protein
VNFVNEELSDSGTADVATAKEQSDFAGTSYKKRKQKWNVKKLNQLQKN